MHRLLVVVVSLFLGCGEGGAVVDAAVDAALDAGPAPHPAFELPCDCPGHVFPCPAADVCGEDTTCDSGICQRACVSDADCPEEGAECAPYAPRTCMYTCTSDADCTTVPGLDLCVQGNCWP